jgi:uncharacterized protein
MAETFQVEIGPGERVTALCYSAAARRRLGATLVLGHGAGANQMSEFMVTVGGGLAALGLNVVTFNFRYAELRRRAPDPPEKLQACYRAVIVHVRQHRDQGSQPLVLGGKSLGGRIASEVAADWALQAGAPPRALVFLGYPLHPPGRPERLRTSHLVRLRVPMLFVQGTRDSFGTPDEVRSATAKLAAPVDIDPVEGGDHSFTVAKTWPLAQEVVLGGVCDRVTAWIAKVIG